MKKFFKWLEKNKDKPLALLFRFLYSISNDWVKTIITLVFPIYLSVLYENGSEIVFYILMILYAIIELWYTLVNLYKNNKYKDDKDNKLILDEINVITTTLDNYINNESNVEGIFEFASDLVSASLYNTLQRVIDSEIRISIVQQFKFKNQKQCVMLSRNSKTRQKCNKSRRRVKYEKNKDYYYLKILVDNKDSMIIFNEEQIGKHFFYKNKDMKSHIKQYLCIPDKHQTDDIIFLLQLDAMEENAFGKDREEINDFYNNYIYPYICFLRHAYNIERNLKKKEGDKDE